MHHPYGTCENVQKPYGYAHSPDRYRRAKAALSPTCAESVTRAAHPATLDHHRVGYLGVINVPRGEAQQVTGAETTKGQPKAGAALDFISHSPEQTRRLGMRLGRQARAGDLILLAGPFGAGKTLLTQGIAAGLEVTERVTSPSFTLVNEYSGRSADKRPVRLYHADLYRLETAAAVASIGLDEFLADPDGIGVIEWPDRLHDLDTLDHLLIVLSQVSETKRRLTLTPSGARPMMMLTAVRAEAFGVGQ